MPLRSSIVGQDLPALAIRVTPRMALAYAAGLGVDAALDDAHEGFAALPFYCVCLEWQLVITARNAILGLSPAEALRAVHAGQNTRFFKPLSPDQTVSVTGRVVGVRRTRVGALALTELRVGGEDGAPISSTLSTGLYRGVEVEGDDALAEGYDPQDPAREPSEDTAEQTIIPIDRGFPHRYSECADIWNPIHTERSVALAAGLPDIIVHGTALWALAGRTLVDRFAAGAPERLTRLDGRFAAMVIPGAAITVRHGRLASDGGVAFQVLNVQNEPAIAAGRAVFAAA